ncbi:hypothetical protein LCGC14_1831330 [marine sediment metagenome]|uniref:Uncharacterized protein n=1 Tax=marine sediment metagenome TaxID=412755 RepID=A0A0F9IVJ5_9ZZZZ
MARQWMTPEGFVIDEDGEDEYMLPVGFVINEDQAVAAGGVTLPIFDNHYRSMRAA